MEIYEHTLDANEDWENWYTTVLSIEPITVDDFQRVINEAQEALLEEWGHKGDWNDVARKITEIDERFFFPEKGRWATVTREKSEVVG